MQSSNSTQNDFSLDHILHLFMSSSQRTNRDLEGDIVAKKNKKKNTRSNKDRHSKINTARGPRDRRMRLSLDVARKFFHLQDLLGFDRASNTVDWLLSTSRHAIADLRRQHQSPPPPPCFVPEEEEKPVKEKEKKKKKHNKRMKARGRVGRESRRMARERARERTSQKKRQNAEEEDSITVHHVYDEYFNDEALVTPFFIC